MCVPSPVCKRVFMFLLPIGGAGDQAPVLSAFNERRWVDWGGGEVKKGERERERERETERDKERESGREWEVGESGGENSASRAFRARGSPLCLALFFLFYFYVFLCIFIYILCCACGGHICTYVFWFSFFANFRICVLYPHHTAVDADRSDFICTTSS